MSKARILVLGDSHTQSLRKALTRSTLRPQQLEVDIHWLATEKKGVLRGDLKIEDASAMVKSLGGKDILVVTLLGTAHNIFGLLQHSQPYWLCENRRDENIGSSEVVPRNAMWDMFEYWHRRNKRVAQIKECSSVRMFHLMTPPPKQDSEFIKARTKSYRDTVVAESGIAPAELRIRLWRLEMQVLGKLCGEWGIGLIPPPSESVCPEGFLHRDYYADDATHANAAYGALVLQQLGRIALSAESQD